MPSCAKDNARSVNDAITAKKVGFGARIRRASRKSRHFIRRRPQNLGYYRAGFKVRSMGSIAYLTGGSGK